VLPVVCLPGIRGNARIFDPLVAHVAAEQGHSGLLHPLDLPPGAPALAASRLMSRLPPGPFFLLTGSYGGLVARFLPEPRMVGLACVGTLASPGALDPAMARRARLLMALPDGMLERLYHQHGRRSLRAAGVPEPTVAATVERPLPASVLRTRLRAVLAGHHGRWPAVPTVRVWGHRDPQYPPPAEPLPGVRSLRVEGGHFPHASHPAALWRALQQALGAVGWPGPSVRTDTRLRRS